MVKLIINTVTVKMSTESEIKTNKNSNHIYNTIIEITQNLLRKKNCNDIYKIKRWNFKFLKITFDIIEQLILVIRFSKTVKYSSQLIFDNFKISASENDFLFIHKLVIVFTFHFVIPFLECPSCISYVENVFWKLLLSNKNKNIS